MPTRLSYVDATHSHPTRVLKKLQVVVHVIWLLLLYYCCTSGRLQVWNEYMGAGYDTAVLMLPLLIQVVR